MSDAMGMFAARCSLLRRHHRRTHRYPPQYRRVQLSHAVRVLLIATVLLATFVPAAAQQPTAILVGAVTTATGSPLVNAQVVVVGTDIGILTRSGGHFRLSGIPAGRQTVEVRFLGYRTERLSLDLEAGQMLRVQVELAIDPVPLERVEINTPRSRSIELQGFYRRRAQGFGHFLTREQIDGMQARLVTDVMRRVPGVQILPVSGRMGTDYVAQMGRAALSSGRICPVLYYVNGIPFSTDPDAGINTFVRADDIAAMEVYSGVSQIPPEFNSSLHGSRCGVVVIWTHGGERRQSSNH